MKRNSAVDFFRGLCLLVMMVDHLQLFAFESLNYLQKYTFESLGFVSAAEGFVFISGLMSGLVYGKLALASLTNFSHKLKMRILKIYKYHFVTVSIIAVCFTLPIFYQHWDIEWQGKLALWKEAPLKAWLYGIVFLYQTSFIDVLPLYIMLMTGLLFFMPLLVRKRAKVILSFSVLLWVAGQFYPQQALGERLGFLLGWFEILSWQLLFFSGVTLGFLALNTKKIPHDVRLFTLALLLSISFFLLRHFGYEYVHESDLFSVRVLGVARLLNFFSIAYVFYFLSHQWPETFAFKPLTILGENSLRVFTIHLIVVYGLGPLKNFISSLSQPLALLFFLFAVSFLYLPILWKNLRFPVLAKVLYRT